MKEFTKRDQLVFRARQGILRLLEESIAKTNPGDDLKEFSAACDKAERDPKVIKARKRWHEARRDRAVFLDAIMGDEPK